jgi:taurine dioxygenase/putative 2-oxoglutarate oxygenase
MIEVRPLHATLAAEITGARRGLPLDAADFAAVEAAWQQCGVLVFRASEMTPAQQIAFTRRLGKLHVMTPLRYNLEGYPEVFVVANDQENGRAVGMRKVGLGWHTDGEDKAVPNAASFLYAMKLPGEGGDTLFADGYAAYEALPADVRVRIQGRRARFSRTELHKVHYPEEPPYTPEQVAERPDVWHPLVRLHPRSGRHALYIGRWAVDIEGMEREEGRALIAFLQEFSTRPEFVYRHRWRLHDAVLWDNRCSQHCATGYDESKYIRRMHRTTLEGELPVMAPADPQVVA